MSQTYTEDQRKYFEFIQNIITRMNSNSFLIKGWTITILTALFVLSISTTFLYFIPIGIIPIIAFWILDTIYLKQERQFRYLYADAISPNSTVVLFNMKTNAYRNLPKTKFKKVLISKTIFPFYFTLLLLLVLGYFTFKSNFNAKENNSNVYTIELKDTLNVKNVEKLKFHRHSTCDTSSSNITGKHGSN